MSYNSFYNSPINVCVCVYLKEELWNGSRAGWSVCDGDSCQENPLNYFCKECFKCIRHPSEAASSITSSITQTSCQTLPTLTFRLANL